MKKVVLLVIVLLMGAISPAGLVTVNYDGVVLANAYYMGFSPALFNVGDAFHLTLTWDNVANKPTYIKYVIGTESNGLTYQVADFSSFFTSATDNGSGLFAYAIGFGSMNKNNLAFTGNQQPWNFSHNLFDGQPNPGPNSYNFNAGPIPEPATMLLLGLGAVLLRKKK